MDGSSVRMAGRAVRHLNPLERLAHEPCTRPLRLAAALFGGRTGRKSKVRFACTALGAGVSCMAHPLELWDMQEPM